MSTTGVPKFPRPVTGDCAEYFFRYVRLVPDTDIVSFLEQQRQEFHDFIASLPDDQLRHRYAPGKWSLAEMIGHVLDTERVFAYRLMCISRGEQQHLPGFEQDDYVQGSVYDTIAGPALAGEWNAIRSSTLYLCAHMTHDMAMRMGIASEKPVRATAYPYMIAGHVLHHLQVARTHYLAEAVQ